MVERVAKELDDFLIAQLEVSPYLVMAGRGRGL